MRSALLKILVSVNDPMSCPPQKNQICKTRRDYRGVSGTSQPQLRLTGIQAQATLTWALLRKSEENGNMKKITFIIPVALCLLFALKVSPANAQTKKDPCAN